MPPKRDLRTQLREAQNRIVTLFLDQCRNGAQSLPLRDFGASACGQFLGPRASGLRQRGLHGTASALAVIAGANSDAQLIGQLVRYIQDRRSIEEQLAGSQEQQIKIRAKCNRDDNNVIKLSEVIYALGFVKTAVCETEDLVKSLAERLLKGRKSGGGWRYYLDDPEEGWDPVPTAYAIRALYKDGYDIRAETDLLQDGLLKPRQEWDIAVQVLVLYVLSSIEAFKASDGTSLKEMFVSRWRKLERLLSFDVEQNIEYWLSGETFYIRIPWQLYLLRLSSRLTPWRFASKAGQVRLRSILNDLSQKGFRYPHSGNMLSARTNAILFETLNDIDIDQQLSYVRFFRIPLYIIDWIREVLGSRLVTIIGTLVGLGVVALSLDQWVRTGHHFAEVAPEFIGGAVSALLSFRKTR